MILFLLLVILIPQKIHSPMRPRFTVWNVGQGAWSTLVSHKDCHHIDMGGEKLSMQKALKLCGSKQNYIYLTHLDWDHINQIKKFLKQTQLICLMPFKPHKEEDKILRWLKDVPRCEKLKTSNVRKIHNPTHPKTRNEASLVYSIGRLALVTGDSPMRQEKLWLHKAPTKTKILILGHHGSRTSTSIELLNKIAPQMAIASARKKRFGHPHKNVKKKLKKRAIPLIKTEEWGNLHFEL